MTTRNRPVVRPPADNAPQLQVTARPVMPTVEARRDTGFQKLAESLAQLQPGIRNYLLTKQDEHRGEQERLAEERMSGLTFEEARSLRESGELTNSQDPWYVRSVNTLYGVRTARTLRDNLLTEYQTSFDRTNGDFDEWFTGQFNEGLEGLGGDTYAREAFVTEMGAVRAGMDNMRSQDVSTIMAGQVQDGAFDILRDIARQGLDHGLNPQEIHRSLRDTYGAFGQNFGLDPAGIDEIVWTLINTFADEGQYDLVQELLMGDRFQPNDALGRKREYATRGAEVLDHAMQRRSELSQRENLPVFIDFFQSVRNGEQTDESIADFAWQHGLTPDQVVSFSLQNDTARQGALAAQQRIAADNDHTARLAELDAMGAAYFVEGRLGDFMDQSPNLIIAKPDGSDQSFSREDLEKRAVDAYLRWSRGHTERNGESAIERFYRELPVFAANGVVHSEWDAALSRAPQQAQHLFGGGTLSEEAVGQVTQAVGVYTALHAVNPALLDRMVSEDEATFFEAVRLSLQYGTGEGTPGFEVAGADMRQAITAGLQRIRDVGGSHGQTNAATLTAIRETVQGTMGGSWLPFSGSGATNRGYIAGEIERLAGLFAGAGMVSAEEALQRAKERFEATHVVARGTAIYNADRRLAAIPADELSDLFNTRIEQLAPLWREEEGLTEENITIGDPAYDAPFGGNTWYQPSDLSVRAVVNTPGAFYVSDVMGWPAMTHDGSIITITTDDLLRLREERRQEIIRGRLEDADRRTLQYEQPFEDPSRPGQGPVVP